MEIQDELNNIERNRVWELIPRPKKCFTIGTKWVFRNKLNEPDIVTRNKAKLVAQGHNQEVGIDYDEIFAPVARLEVIRMLLTFESFKNFRFFQMNVKSAFLNSFIEEQVYIDQPPSFEIHEFWITFSIETSTMCLV